MFCPFLQSLEKMGLKQKNLHKIMLFSVYIAFVIPNIEDKQT